MIQGSHNTMTYLKPKYWIFNLFSFIWKCQNKDIFIQYHNTQVFDLRITFDNKIPCFAHGIVKLKGAKVTDILEALNNLGNCKVRIILEEPKRRKNTDYYTLLFNNYVSEWIKTYKYIEFFEGTRKYDWFKIMNNKVKPNPKYIQKISSMDGKWYNKLFPRLYSFMNNKSIKKQYKDNNDTIVFMDFIDFID